jgi:hypothetical protein
VHQSVYRARFTPVTALDATLRAQMAALYLAHYDGSSPALFAADLAAKDEVLLLHADGALVGFSTFRLFRRVWQGRPIRVIYSGDTVVERPHWGQQALAFAWIERMGQLKRQAPELPLYWLLLVKGHRTFRYLPVFGHSFHPHWAEPRPDLQALADQLAAELFGTDYQPACGVVAFNPSRGHLKPEIATPTTEELARGGVRFFLARNPGYQQGHELVCLCEMEAHNMKPLTRRLFERGLRDA